MSTHIENVARVVSAEMVKAGVSKDVAPTAAQHAAERIVAGEQGDAVVRELVEFYGSAIQAKPETVKPVSTEAPHDRRTADRVRIGLAGGNPWDAASPNITRQILVEHADPALATRLRSEAQR